MEASEQSHLCVSVLAAERLTLQRKIKKTIILEKSEEVKHIIQTKSNATSADKAAVRDENIVLKVLNEL